MKKHVAQRIVESVASWNSLLIIELSDEEYGLQGTQEELFSCVASVMLELLNCIYEHVDEYYERLEVIGAFENLKHVTSGTEDIWY